jgi:hypothetical protein
MKYVKTIYTILGVIPFLWLVSFVTILCVGTIRLGYIPKYGNRIDPDALNINFLSLVQAILAILAYIAFFLWIVITSLLVSYFRKKITPNRVSIYLFLIGVISFFILKYIFTEYFLWVED